ncbi:MAG: hypothetical protein J0I15_03905 [Herbaspirillum huttiense]|uniref:hypothetical protein n=1 Tax=Herbaspirillum huttiense TaxID=863372 RepID=UPI0009FE00CD|nr:hypothetical protein [Herbaspirillum huttiense]
MRWPAGCLSPQSIKIERWRESGCARGREAHKNYKNALGDDGYEFNKALPGGSRPDALNYTNNTVRELEPDNPDAMRQGWRQLEKYA